MKKDSQILLIIFFWTTFLLIDFVAYATDSIETVRIDAETVVAYQDSAPGIYYLQTHGSLLRIVNHGNRNADFEFYATVLDDVEFGPHEIKALLDGKILMDMDTVTTELFHERTFHRDKLLFILTYPFILPKEKMITYYRLDDASSNVHSEIEILYPPTDWVIRIQFWTGLLVLAMIVCVLATLFQTRWARVFMVVVLWFTLGFFYLMITKGHYGQVVLFWPSLVIVLIYAIFSTKKMEMDW